MGTIHFFFSSALRHCLRATTLASLALCTASVTSVVAEGIPPVWESQKYQPPIGLGTPGNLSQGGTRQGDPSANTSRFIPLVPQSNNFGVTTAAYPSILVYVSQNVSEMNVDTLEFLLLDDAGNEVYRARFAVELEDQLLRIDLPRNAGLAALEEGKDYLWLLEGFTQDFTLTENLFTYGWIRRVPPTEALTENLQASNSTEDVANAYIDERIWYDAIAKLEEGFTNGQNTQNATLINQWKALLASAGVEDEVIDDPNLVVVR